MADHFVIRTEEDKQQLYHHLKSRELPYLVAIAPYAPERTVPQNSYLWYIYHYIADHTGHSVYELHEAFKLLFIAPPLFDIISHSTAKLNQTEFSTYVNNIVNLAADMGITIPPPEAIISNPCITSTSTPNQQ